MRYYDLKLTPPSGASSQARRWTSHPQGISGPADPGAQNIEFDFLISPQHIPSGDCSISIEGVDLPTLLQANQFGAEKAPFWTIEFSGGMAPGLPLNNPKQAGLIAKGFIFQAFGNWQGTEMTLDLVFKASTDAETNPQNIVLNWKAGTPLSQTLANSFSTGLPGWNQQINISPNFVQSHDEVGYYPTWQLLAQDVYELTTGWAGNPLASGVNITLQNNTVSAQDSTYQPAATQIEFTDLIGQPTWIQPNIMMLKLVMRADLQVGGMLKLPKGMQNIPGMVHTSAASLPSSMKYSSTFNGQFLISEIRQVGNFRSSDAAQWSTIAMCIPQGNASLCAKISINFGINVCIIRTLSDARRMRFTAPDGHCLVKSCP